MKSRWFLVPAAILGLALLSSLSTPVAAATPSVKLVLDGTGATPWAIGPIAPGDSGTETVTLRNTGFSDGVVTIWISDIVNSEGTNPQSETGNTAEPGELGDYLLLNVSGTNLSTDFILPAKIGNFPQGEADTKHIYVNPLKAFSTLNLQWEWRLPLETGDDIQGDKLSFTINYMLEESPSLPAPPQAPQGGGGAPEAITRVGITMTGPSGVFSGFTRSYTMTVTNPGTVALNDVVVTNYLPALQSYQSSIPAGIVTGSQIAWNLGILNVGETKEIVIILGGVEAGTAVDTATVTTREGVSATDSLTTTVLGAPGAHMSLIDSRDPVAVGDQFTYTIKVLNQSESNNLHNMTIMGLIPGETVYVSADGPTPFTVAGNEVRFGPVAELKSGATVEFHIVVKATVAGAAVFNATMRWDEFGEPIVAQEGTTVFGGTIADFTPSPPLPPAPVLPQAAPANKDTFTIGTLPQVLPAPSGIQKVKSIWLIAVILAVIGEAALVYYIVLLIMRRRSRWDWIPYILTSGRFNVIAQTAEQRTLYVTKHQKRVAELASAIAREMNLSNKLVKMLLMVGIIHDSGSVEMPHPVAQTALQYQERLNGSGYPQKQAGDDILLEARILAMADTVETMADTVKGMSSPRPYRPARGMAKALEEIKRNSSTLYDSEVVKAFVRLVERGKFGFQTLYS